MIVLCRQKKILLLLSVFIRLRIVFVLACLAYLPARPTAILLFCSAISLAGFACGGAQRFLINEKLDAFLNALEERNLLHEIRWVSLAKCAGLNRKTVVQLAARLPSLVFVDLAAWPACTDKSLKALCTDAAQLESLLLSQCWALSPAALAQVRVLHQLVRLDLSFTKANEAALVRISRGCRRLRRLLLAGCRELTSDALTAALANLADLRELNVSFIDEAHPLNGELPPGVLDRFKKPRDPVVTQRVFAAMPAGLERLSARGSPHIDDQCLNALGKRTRYLRSIDVADGAQVTEAGLERLAIECGALQSFFSDAAVQDNVSMTFNSGNRAPAPLEPFKPPDISDLDHIDDNDFADDNGVFNDHDDDDDDDGNVNSDLAGADSSEFSSLLDVPTKKGSRGRSSSGRAARSRSKSPLIRLADKFFQRK